ncbi:MAG TPA: hypothetical protein VFP84_19045, partial [Kofleriaceae bacterium]|nr:hypothetical protein [Kofleriaceae bacterium]
SSELSSFGLKAIAPLADVLAAGDTATKGAAALALADVVTRGDVDDARWLLGNHKVGLKLAALLESSGDDAAAATRTPNPPTTNVPSGAIWPPVEGRALLQEISTVDLVPRRLAHGDWVAGLGSGWRVMSSRDALYPTLDHGRSALIQWARLHASAASILSSHRCIVLSDDGTGRWRLWQLVRAEPSLREAVDDAFFEDGREAVIAGLRRVAQWLVDADAQLASLPVALPCTLENLGPGDGGVSYIGFMPDANTAPTPPRPRDPLTALLTALEPIIAHELVERGIDLEEIIGHIQPSAADRQDTPTLLGA